jgi:hypothetical protein
MRFMVGGPYELADGRHRRGDSEFIATVERDCCALPTRKLRSVQGGIGAPSSSAAALSFVRPHGIFCPALLVGFALRPHCGILKLLLVSLLVVRAGAVRTGCEIAFDCRLHTRHF